MKEGELLYFSEEEFALMLELAGSNEYSLFLTASELDEQHLIEAFVSLFQRGLLVREKDSFLPSGEGAFFSQIRSSSHIILIRAFSPEDRTLLCYVYKNTLWIAELQNGIPSERYRLRMLSSKDAASWISDMDILPQPMLLEEDTTEFKLIFPDDLNPESDDEAMVQITKYTGSGVCLCEYSLYSGPIGPLLRISNGENSQVYIYTQEKRTEILSDCFGG